MVTSQTTAYDGRGRPIAFTNVDGVVSRSTYDGLGRTLSTTMNYVAGVPSTAITNVTSLVTYEDGLGRITVRTDPTGVTHETQLDGMLNPILSRDSVGRETWTWHDITGQTRWTRTPDQTITVTHVDGLGRVVKTIRNYQNGIVEPTDAADEDSTLQTVYDRGGRVIAIQEPDGRIDELTYNLRDHLRSVTENVEDTTACPATTTRTDCTVRTEYIYDRAGNRRFMIDARGFMREWTYTAQDTLKSQHVVGASQTERQWTYDASGKLLTQYPVVGDLTEGPRDLHYTYDELGREIARVDPLGSGTADPHLYPSIHVVYDALGRQTQLHEGSHGVTQTASLTYDPLGRLIQSADPNGTVQYGYDAAGRRTETRITAPSPAISQIVYGGDGQPRYVYGATGTTTIPPLLASYGYDLDTGRLDRIIRENGANTTYTYDDLGQVVSIQTTVGTTIVTQFDYTYDRAGRRIQMVEQGSLINPKTTTYTYDGLGRLTQEVDSSTGETRTYAYDKNGNRLQVTVNGVVTQSRSYDAANRVVGWTYDAAGNLRATTETTSTFDIHQRLRAVDTGLDQVAYGYLDTMLLNRTVTSTEFVGSSYVQDWAAPMSRILMEKPLQDEATFAIYGGAADRLATITGNAKAVFGLADALGTERASLDLDTTLRWQQDFDTWGNKTSESGYNPTTFGFTGELHDPLTGLVYLRTRWYAPQEGTFISPDPFAGWAETPYSMHPYQYGYSDPVLNTDPTGMCIPEDIAFIGQPGCEFLGWNPADWNWSDAGDYSRGAIKGIAEVIDSQLAILRVPNPVESVRTIASIGYLASNPSEIPGFLKESILAPWNEWYIGWLCYDFEKMGHGGVGIGEQFVVLTEAGVGWYHACLRILQRIGKFLPSPSALPRPRPSIPDVDSPTNRPDVDDPDGSTRPIMCSFDGSTLVATSTGFIAIRDLVLGDTVLAYNEVEQAVGSYEIVATTAHTDPVVLDLEIDGEAITTTPEHPFFTQHAGWVPAGDLAPGTRIRTAAGTWGTLESITRRATPTTMYNLTVTTAHTFFVGEGQWLVHNMCGTPADIAGNTPIKPSAQGSVSQSRVEKYAAAMKNGTFNWETVKLKGDPIIVIKAKNGMFLEQGHHRFLASRLAEIEIPDDAIIFRDYSSFDWPMAAEWKDLVWDEF